MTKREAMKAPKICERISKAVYVGTWDSRGRGDSSYSEEPFSMETLAYSTRSVGIICQPDKQDAPNSQSNSHGRIEMPTGGRPGNDDSKHDTESKGKTNLQETTICSDRRVV